VSKKWLRPLFREKERDSASAEAQTVKKGHCNLPSADCKSKIGDMRGDFRAILLAKSLPYANERPGGPLVARPVSECKSSKKCLQHFFDTLRFRFCGSGHFSRSAKADGREKCKEWFRQMPNPPRPRGKAPRYDYSQRASGPSDTSQGGFLTGCVHLPISEVHIFFKP